MARAPLRLSHWLITACVLLFPSRVPSQDADSPLAIAPFTADVTIPAGHRCMGILPTRAISVDDPLEAHGFVLLGAGQPIVLLALDWCEVRNGAYDQWRAALAEAAVTDRGRVLVSSLHQHDAPVVDSGAQDYLDAAGLPLALYDREFHSDCIARVCDALRSAVRHQRPVTHLGTGSARVDGVASSRRVILPDGRISYDRYSSSGGDAFLMAADEGPIDPLLRTISFWNGDVPLLALHSYATHPMSRYGQGLVSADFPGLARRLRLADDTSVAQIYVSGCSGDVTAGKFNDGTPPMRALLAERLHRAMTDAWKSTTRVPLTASHVDLHSVPLRLPFHDGPEFSRSALEQTLADVTKPESERILAALSLSSRDRIDRDQAIDLIRLNLGEARIVLFPGESFVGYQLRAQELAPQAFTMSIGYGECWPGYVPTQQAFDEGFNHDWRWVSREAPAVMEAAMQRLLLDTP